MRRALSFLTAVGGASEPTPEALSWFPAVGAVVGLALGGVWWLADRAWPAFVAAAVVVVADLALTGLLHLDGLVDAADGLLAHLARGRRLEVMAEPGVGAFGAGTAASVLLLRWVALAGLAPSPLLLAGLWCASRSCMAVGALVVPYARPEGGLASSFLGRPGRALPLAVGGLGAALALLLAWHLVVGGPVLVCATLAAAGVIALAKSRLGGFTGDVLGAAGMVGETVGLLVAVARW